MKWISDKTILIVGLGLIGGSYAMVLKKMGYKVNAIDINKNTIEYAKQNNIIDKGSYKNDKKLISTADVIIFGLYPKTLLEWVKKYHSYIKKGTLITDVTGVKEYMIYDMQDILFADGIEYIASHPMAGREVYGIQNAKPDIFREANFIITPTNRNTTQAINWARELGCLLGFKNVTILTPKEHDDMVAFLSQMTHTIAIALMTCKDNKELVNYTGDSFRDLTRIAKINENMWSELFLINKQKLVSEMDNFIKEFINIRNIIDSSDVEALKDKMRLSTYRRSFFDKQK